MKRGGGALMHVYVLEHIVSLCYRTTRWMFTKLGRDEVLMAPHLWLDFSANPAQGWIQGRAKIGKSGDPSSKDCFRLEGYSKRMHSNDLEAR